MYYYGCKQRMVWPCGVVWMQFKKPERNGRNGYMEELSKLWSVNIELFTAHKLWAVNISKD